MDYVEGVRRAWLKSNMPVLKHCYVNAIFRNEHFIRYYLPIWLARYTPSQVINYLCMRVTVRDQLIQDAARRSSTVHQPDDEQYGIILGRKILALWNRQDFAVGDCPDTQTLWILYKYATSEPVNLIAYVYTHLQDTYSELPYFNELRKLSSFDDAFAFLSALRPDTTLCLDEMKYLPMKLIDIRTVWAAMFLTRQENWRFIDTLDVEPAASLPWWVIDFPEQVIHKMNVEAGYNLGRILKYIHCFPLDTDSIYYKLFLREKFGDKLEAAIDIYQNYVSCYLKEEHLLGEEREVPFHIRDIDRLYSPESIQPK